MHEASQEGAEEGAPASPRCTLLGETFGIFVQIGLGIAAITTLIYKRATERPRRPVRCTKKPHPRTLPIGTDDHASIEVPPIHPVRYVTGSGLYGSLTLPSKHLQACCSIWSTWRSVSFLHVLEQRANAPGTCLILPSLSHAVYEPRSVSS